MAKSAEPLNRHENGEGMPEEPVKDPYEWTPILETIPEGSKEDTESWASAESWRSVQ